LDVLKIEAVYKALLETYDSEVLHALAKSCRSLIEGA
jgi:hypothetical protein